MGRKESELRLGSGQYWQQWQCWYPMPLLGLSPFSWVQLELHQQFSCQHQFASRYTWNLPALTNGEKETHQINLVSVNLVQIQGMIGDGENEEGGLGLKGIWNWWHWHASYPVPLPEPIYEHGSAQTSTNTIAGAGLKVDVGAYPDTRRKCLFTPKRATTAKVPAQ